MNEDTIDEVFETYEKYTTMMYRPPEMIDKYRRFNVSTKVDIWVSRGSSKLITYHVDVGMCRLHSVLRVASIHGESKAGYLHGTL